MAKKSEPAKPAHGDKGFIALAGEAFHVLGEEIIEGKDKVLEVASDKFAAVKKVIRKITHKKARPARQIARKVVKQDPPRKGVRQDPPKKVAKKTPAKKILKKVATKVSATPKKAVKKAAKKVAAKVSKKAASVAKKR